MITRKVQKPGLSNYSHPNSNSVFSKKEYNPFFPKSYRENNPFFNIGIHPSNTLQLQATPTGKTEKKEATVPTKKSEPKGSKTTKSIPGPKKPAIPSSMKKKSKTKKDLNVYVYDTGDKALGPIWEASARAFAKSVDGLAVHSGSSAASTLDNIVVALQNNKKKYGCIRSIEFFGHGSAGATLATSKGEIKEADIPTAAATASSKTGSHASTITTLEKNFSRLRDSLCGSSFIHFRSCETMKGAQGQKFASRLAKYLGKTYLIGHTKIIDINLPGREVYDPTGAKMKPSDKIPTSLIKPKKKAQDLPVQKFNIEIDLGGLGKGKSKAKYQSLPRYVRFLLAGRNKIKLFAKVLDHTDAEKYLLQATLVAPTHVSLGSLEKALKKLAPSGTIGGPTLPHIKAKGDAIELPIDRRLIERIAALQKLSFPYPTDYGTVRVSIAGGKSEPGYFTRKGGIEFNTGAIFSPQYANSILGVSSLHLPLGRFGFNVNNVPINAFQVYTGLDALYGDQTMMGRLKLGMKLDMETLNLNMAVFGGGGQFEGKPEWMVGGNLGVGTKIGNFTADAGWEFFWTGQNNSFAPSNAGFLKLGWVFQ